MPPWPNVMDVERVRLEVFTRGNGKIFEMNGYPCRSNLTSNGVLACHCVFALPCQSHCKFASPILRRSLHSSFFPIHDDRSARTHPRRCCEANPCHSLANCSTCDACIRPFHAPPTQRTDPFPSHGLNSHLHTRGMAWTNVRARDARMQRMEHVHLAGWKECVYGSTPSLHPSPAKTRCTRTHR